MFYLISFVWLAILLEALDLLVVLLCPPAVTEPVAASLGICSLSLLAMAMRMSKF